MDPSISTDIQQNTFVKTQGQILPAISLLCIGLAAIVLPNLIGMAFNTYVAALFACVSLCLLGCEFLKLDKANLDLHIPVLLLVIALIVWFDSRVSMTNLGLIAGIFYLVNAVSIWSRFEKKNKVYALAVLVAGSVSALAGIQLIFFWPLHSALGISLAFGLPFVFHGSLNALITFTKRH